MPLRNVSASEAAAVLKRQGYVGHTTRIATEAKGALSACRSGDMARRVPYSGARQGNPRVAWRAVCNVSIGNSFESRTAGRVPVQNPFLRFGPGFFSVGHALRGSCPIKGSGASQLVGDPGISVVWDQPPGKASMQGTPFAMLPGH